jgi:hypothetical protein
MTRKYGPPRLDCREDAAWIDRFMHHHALTAEALSHIVGVNPARVWEWKHQQKPVPEDVRRRLEHWDTDGCPRFAYWD